MPVERGRRRMDRVSAVPCPRCGEQPKLVQVSFTVSRSRSESSIGHYSLRCTKWLGIRICFSPCKTKAVANGNPWYRWEQDLIDEWNAKCAKRVVSLPVAKVRRGAR